MALTKQNSGMYWADFTRNGIRYQRSTGMRNREDAKDIETIWKKRLMEGKPLDPLPEETRECPRLREFIETRFLFWATTHCEAKRGPDSATLKRWYLPNLKTILAHAPLANCRLDHIGSEVLAGFISARHKAGIGTNTINSSLQVIRKILRYAHENQVISSLPRIELLPAPAKRDCSISLEDQSRYLDAAPQPLADVMEILFTLGMRPMECFGLSWQDVDWNEGRYGMLRIERSKTRNGRRRLPLAGNVRVILENRWLAAGRPRAGFVFPGPAKSGHLELSSIRKHHDRTFKQINEQAEKDETQPLAYFPIYHARHSALTRYARTLDRWALQRLAGHSSISVTERYIGATESADGLLAGMERALPAPRPHLLKAAV